ncbi:MAG TPA: type II methionyl aminopeptidase [Alphaproteobacteria bacterium]|nr:type II methionyl aminopeptidase [Alphaproteobacteria bacterium]
MIVQGQDKENAILAGKIAGKAILYGKSLIEPDARVVEVLDKIEQFIKQNGGEMAFPAQVSLNDTAAHYCPTHDDPTVFKTTDIIKLDLGVHIDGVIADNAVTIVFKKDNHNYEKLHEIKKASEEALANALKYMRPGTKLGEIGLVIQETISKYDLSPIRNLSGHGLGKYQVHENPTVPNFNTGDKRELEDGQLLAVEPFATNGHGMIFESSNPTLYSLTQVKGVRSNMTREVLNSIKTFKNLPFTTRWLTTKHTASTVRFALNDLKNLGIIHEYPPLIEVGRGMVAQSEHTVIVGDNPVITTRREE